MTWRAAVLFMFVLILISFALGTAVGVYGVPVIRAHFHPKPEEPVETLSSVLLATVSPSRMRFDESPAKYLAAPKDHPPERILVGPFHWTVKYVKFGPGGFARSDPKTLEIQMDPTLPRDQLVETLLHEIWHACLFVGNGGYASMTGEPETADLFIEQTIPTFMQVLRDNPELVAWLQEKN